MHAQPLYLGYGYVLGGGGGGGTSLGEWEHNNYISLYMYMAEHLRSTTVFFWSILQCEKELEQVIARKHLVMHKGTCRVERIFINNAIYVVFTHKNSL